MLDERGTYCNSGNCGNYGFAEEADRGFVVLEVLKNSVQVKRHIVPLKRKFVTLTVDVSSFQNEKTLENAIDRILSMQKQEDFVRIKIVGYFDESFDKRIDYLTAKYKQNFFYFSAISAFGERSGADLFPGWCFSAFGERSGAVLFPW